MSDVLPHLSRLSKIFQKENVDFSLILPCLQSTIDTISVYEHTDGPNLLKVENILTSDLKDFQILATTTHKNSFKCNVQRMYIQAIVRHLTDRFLNVEIIDAFNIFNPQSMPASEEERATYAKKSCKRS